MATAGTPSRKYPYHVPLKIKAKGYEIRLAAQFGDTASKYKLQAYNRRIKERKMEANKSEWVVEGRSFNRYKMLDFIITRVANGESLPKICSADDMPSMLQVYEWFDSHPDARTAYNRAEEVRGHILGEEALQTARDTDRENVAADKLKFEALSKAAARSNTRFQDKATVKIEDEFANLSADQIKDRIRRIIQTNPDLVGMVPQDALAMSGVIIEAEEQVESPGDELPEDGILPVNE